MPTPGQHGYIVRPYLKNYLRLGSAGRVLTCLAYPQVRSTATHKPGMIMTTQHWGGGSRRITSSNLSPTTGIFLNCSSTLFFEAVSPNQTQSSLTRLLQLASCSGNIVGSPPSKTGITNPRLHLSSIQHCCGTRNPRPDPHVCLACTLVISPARPPPTTESI